MFKITYDYKNEFMILYAVSGNHVLLHKDEVKVIGSITEINRFDIIGELKKVKKVELNYGTMYTDVFYFENDNLVYWDISYKSYDYINDLYHKLIKMNNKSSNLFLEELLSQYVFTEMGF